jgi:putative transposase
MQQLTAKLRLRDKRAVELNRQARAVNFAWNYCNDAQKHTFQTRRAWRDKWLSYSALAAATAGPADELGLHSHTIQRVCWEYAKSRKQKKKRWLRYRGRKSLGWVPFNSRHGSLDGKTFIFRGVQYTTTRLRDTLKPGIKIGAGSFNQDARGRWYINVPVEVECADSVANTRVGIDLGLDTLAGLSDGCEIAPPRFSRKSEEKLATTQRANKTPKRIRNIHVKIATRRKDFLHEQSARIVKEYGLVVVGNVSPSRLAKTNMAKSVLDAGWAGFKHMLSHEAITHGGMCLEVNEAYRTRICSECGALSGPKGIADLGIRDWSCSECGAVHRRGTNSTKVILRVGLHTLVGGTNG